MNPPTIAFEPEVPAYLGACPFSTDCVKVLDSDGRVQFFNTDGLLLMEIDDFLSVKGVYWPSLWPGDGQRLAEEALKVARQVGVSTFRAACPTAKGTPKWWDVTVAAIPGAQSSFAVVSRDVTADIETRRLERETTDRFRLVNSASLDVHWDIDLELDKVWWGEGMQSMFGYGPDQIGETTKWCHDHIHPEDRERVVASMGDAVGDGSAIWEGEFRYLAADGGYLDVHDRGAIIRDADGKAVRFVGIMQDVTARNAASARYRLVAAEFAHRVNNTLAVVTGLFQQSLRASTDVSQLSEAFGGRLLAMANANIAILRGGGERATLRDIAQPQLAPFIGAGRLRIDGPDVVLSTQYAQPLALTLNELATNALKYGSLSAPGGSVDLTWTVQGDGVGRRLTIQWTESGGPPVTPPTRGGLGSKLIEKGIRGAIVERRFDPDGFKCRVELTL